MRFQISIEHQLVNLSPDQVAMLYIFVGGWDALEEGSSIATRLLGFGSVLEMVMVDSRPTARLEESQAFNVFDWSCCL